MSDSTPPISYSFQSSTYPQVFTVAKTPRRPYWLHALLLLLTFGTTLVVGAQLAFNYHHRLPAFEFGPGWMPLFHPVWVFHNPSLLLTGLPFSVTLMCILMAHEMGHFVLCEKYGVYATLPFFIPAPTLIGTMGAFIRIKSPIRSRQALFDIGVAGPIAGFIAAIPFLFIGLLLSRPVGFSQNTGYEIGFPLVFQLAYLLVKPVMHQAVPITQLSLHPIAIAAWIGMFATALNLIPGGQLDGGHIVYAVAPHAHKRVTRISVVVLSLLGLIGLLRLFISDGRGWAWPGWLLWAVILAATGWRHPSVPLWPGLDGTRRWLALVALLLLVLTFCPLLLWVRTSKAFERSSKLALNTLQSLRSDPFRAKTGPRKRVFFGLEAFSVALTSEPTKSFRARKYPLPVPKILRLKDVLRPFKTNIGCCRRV